MAIMRAAKLEPLGPYPGYHTPWICLCTRCKRPTNPTVANVGQGGCGCRTCAPYGYDPSKDGYLYLMERPGEMQVGITNNPKRRLSRHRANGWELVDALRGPLPGWLVLEQENMIKGWLKSRGLCIPGTTENWSTAALEVSSLTDLEAVIAAHEEL